jgi:hypothetical protein
MYYTIALLRYRAFEVRKVSRVRRTLVRGARLYAAHACKTRYTYFSKKNNAYKYNYKIYNKKLLAIIYSLEE